MKRQTDLFSSARVETSTLEQIYGFCEIIEFFVLIVNERFHKEIDAMPEDVAIDYWIPNQWHLSEIFTQLLKFNIHLMVFEVIPLVLIGIVANQKLTTTAENTAYIRIHIFH